MLRCGWAQRAFGHVAATGSVRGKNGSVPALQSGSREVWVAAVSRYVLGPAEDPGSRPGLRVGGPAPARRSSSGGRRLRVVEVAQAREQPQVVGLVVELVDVGPTPCVEGVGRRQSCGSQARGREAAPTGTGRRAHRVRRCRRDAGASARRRHRRDRRGRRSERTARGLWMCSSPATVSRRSRLEQGGDWLARGTFARTGDLGSRAPTKGGSGGRRGDLRSRGGPWLAACSASAASSGGVGDLPGRLQGGWRGDPSLAGGTFARAGADAAWR